MIMPNRFVSFYEDALLGFAAWRDLDALNLFFAICKHANEFGWCNPGDDLLGKESGHRRDAIPALLASLQATDLIHMVLTPVPFRTAPLRGIQVNPYVLRLRPENNSSALADWQRYIPQTIEPNEIQTTSITYGENDRQPDQNQNQLKNQNHNQNQNQQTIQRKTSASADQNFLEGERQKQGQNEEQSEAQSALTTQSDSTSRASAIPPSEPPREPRRLQVYKTPLPHPADEDIAMELVNLTGDLSRENARMLVHTYSYELVERAMRLYRHHNGTVQHPGRWIRAMLRKGTDELWKEQPFNRLTGTGD